MPLKTRTPGTELDAPSSRPLSTRTMLLATRVEAIRANSNNKQQHRPKNFVIAFFSSTPTRRFPAPVITRMQSSHVCEAGDRQGNWFYLERNSNEVRYIYSQTHNQ